ncbi:MAG: polysaccharide biosynthesis/export family protein [Gemmatimonadaceae bacterium]
MPGNSWRAVTAVAAATIFSALSPSSSLGQSPVGWRDPGTTRSALQARATEVQAQASASQNGHERRALSLEADVIERRLKEGDFVVGDRVFVRVEEQLTLADTFTVHSGKMLELPGYGAVVLEGALWSEATERVRDQVATYVKGPRVRVTPLVRIGIMGAVSRPGYYQLSTDTPVADAIMRAGGLLSNGNASGAVVRRADHELWPATAVRDGIAQSLTIDQMALRSGDELDIPEQHRFSAQTFLQIAGVLVGVSAVALSRVRH